MNVSNTLKGGAILSVLLGLTLSSQACDDLWEKSVNLVKQSDLMVPGEMLVEQNIVDGKGKTQLESTTIVGVGEDQGRIHAELLKFVENGNDRTQKLKKEIEKGINEDINDIIKQMPYHVDDPGRLILGRHEGTREVNGVVCVGYDFEASDKDFEKSEEPFRFLGTVWVNPETAVPMLIESELQDLPREEDGADIVSLSQSIDYSYNNGVWQREREVQDLCVKARILFKSIVVNVHTDTQYRKHWKFSVN